MSLSNDAIIKLLAVVALISIVAAILSGVALNNANNQPRDYVAVSLSDLEQDPYDATRYTVYVHVSATSNVWGYIYYNSQILGSYQSDAGAHAVYVVLNFPEAGYLYLNSLTVTAFMSGNQYL